VLPQLSVQVRGWGVAPVPDQLAVGPRGLDRGGGGARRGRPDQHAAERLGDRVRQVLADEAPRRLGHLAPD